MAATTTTLMIKAFQSKDEQSIKRWLDITENIKDVKDTYENTPLILSSRLGLYDISLRILQQDSSLISSQNIAGDTALHIAVKEAKREIVELLVEHGSDVVNIPNDHGNTPLHYACFYHLTDIALYLIEHGGIVGALNRYQKSPLDFCSDDTPLRQLLVNRVKQLGGAAVGDKVQLKIRQVDRLLQINHNLIQCIDLLYKTDEYSVYYGKCNGMSGYIKKLNITPESEIKAWLVEHVTKCHKYAKNNSILMPIMGISLSDDLAAIGYNNAQFNGNNTLDNMLFNPEIPFDNPAKILKIGLDICSALVYLYENGLNHLNLKSKNINIDIENYLVQIFDYSLSNCTGGGVVGERIFEPEYIAPEILKTGKVQSDEAADVYSFGILLYELVTRQYPYDQQNPMHLGLKVVLTGLRPSIPDYIPKYLADLMRLCWREEPSERPGLAQVRKVLEQIILLK